jgi:hypothetical protein
MMIRAFAAATALLFCVSASAAAQAGHEKHQQQGKAGMQHDSAMMKGHMASAWKEMDSFHTVLAATWHPVANAKNVTPLREKADQLAAAARLWSSSTPPAACNADEVKTTVATIASDALAIGNQVMAKASDEDLTKALAALHEKFEGVEKKCGGHDMKGMKH